MMYVVRVWRTIDLATMIKYECTIGYLQYSLLFYSILLVCGYDNHLKTTTKYTELCKN